MDHSGRRARHRMTALLERWDTCADPRAGFAHRWAIACDYVATAAQRGDFADSDWTLTLLDLLVDFYFITVEPDGDDLALVTAGAWQAAHEVAMNRPGNRDRAVLLGYNAMICNDLPQAVGDLLATEWPANPELLAQRRHDVRMVAALIARSMNRGGSVTRNWFTDIWPHALSIVTANDDGWRDLIRDDIELTAMRRAHLIACDIACSEWLLRLSERELDRVFPVHHEKPECRLSVRLPAWGVPAPASS